MTRILLNRPKIYVVMTVRQVLLGVETKCLISEGLDCPSYKQARKTFKKNNAESEPTLLVYISSSSTRLHAVLSTPVSSPTAHPFLTLPILQLETIQLA